MTTPMSIVVVDDSAVQRRFLRGAIDAAPEFDVVGEARNGKEAVALVERLRPHAVVMDLDLPVMGGVEAIERIMATCATPILVYSAFVAGEDSENALEALAAGAVDVLAKPGPQDSGTLDEYADTLRRRLRMVSRIRVITHPRGRLRNGPGGSGEAGHSPKALATVGGRRPLSAPPPVALADVPARDGVKLLVIGASTGGPHALLAVLSALPPDLQQAVLVVQHMAEGFIAGLASWLDQLVPLPVCVGESGRRLEPGTVTIAPSGGNLLVQDDRLRVLVRPPDPGQFHVPGIDAAMQSVADALGPDAVGVLLTGMGRDGAAGLLAMRGRGAFTIGQDEATCAVYGMPAAAAAIDALDRVLPIDAIGPALCEVLQATSPRPR
ncbi:MAG: two-component system, chemotaxis family, protein-glutamate methylesterase/glutaminase [Actinomycetota bacterium]|jgi:two-component system chemotaxis response regulator CheB|nr:two-component system, chemotaxis family, protein-glutamate methylesterase/glutaminase [Actinomycetota bacterium]